MLAYRELKVRDLPRMMDGVVKTVAMVMLLIGFASAFAYMMTLMQIPAHVTSFFLTLSDDRIVILLLINLMLLVLGMFMDMAPLILICTPILLPVVKALGVDPVHFGIIIMLNLGIGLVTPPVGTTLFVGCAIGKVRVDEVARHLWPFWLTMFIVLMLVTYVEPVSMALPRLIGF